MTRAREIAEWVPAGSPTVGQGILVAQADPSVTEFASGRIPFNAVIHVQETEPDPDFVSDGVFWLNPAATELRVYLIDRWLQVSLPDADAEGLIAMTGAAPHEWSPTDDLDGGTY